VKGFPPDRFRDCCPSPSGYTGMATAARTVTNRTVVLDNSDAEYVVFYYRISGI
jgi:hypothetical protein